MLALRFVELPRFCLSAAKCYAERGIPDRARHEDTIPGFRTGPADHGPLRHTAEHGNRNRYRPRSTIGVAPEQRAAEQHCVTPQTLCKSAEPVFFDVLRDRQ